MDILVCIKRVPDTAEIPVTIDESGKGIKEEQLTFDINEADSYALEEALLIKEKLGGSVSIISIGNEETETILRMGLAKGADSAIRIWDDKFIQTLYQSAFTTRDRIKNYEHINYVYVGIIDRLPWILSLRIGV